MTKNSGFSIRVPETHWYEKYLESEHWQEVRKAALERAGYRCQLCNSEGRLHVHHRNYSRLGRELDNDVIALCADCHHMFHQHRKVTSSARRQRSGTGVIAHTKFLVQDGQTYLVLVVRTDDGQWIQHRMNYALHPNGTPHGGSNYRRLWESILERPLHKGERFDEVDIQNLRGTRLRFTVTDYPDRSEIEPYLSDIQAE